MFLSRPPPTVDITKLVLRDGTQSLTANWNVGAFRVTNAANPVDPQDLATKSYVDATSGGLPAGINGGVLAYAGGAWASIAAGTSGQILRSTGGGAPAWGDLTAGDVGAIPLIPSPTWGALFYNPGAGEYQLAPANPTREVLRSNTDGETLDFSTDVAPLTQRAVDAVSNSVSVCATLAHDLLAGVGANGIGARCLIQNRNSAGTLVDTAALDGVFVDATAGAESGALDVRVRASSLLARVARFSSTGLRLDWAARSITLLSFFGGDIDVWRVDGSNRWAYGSTDGVNCGGLVLYTPSTADVSIIRGATTHFSVNGSGNLTLGTISHTTAIQGTAVALAGTTGLQIGYTSVVAVYQGGARVPRRTITALSGGSTHALDASDEVLHVDTTAGAGTLTLPAPSEGRLIVVQRKRGANNLIVQRNAAETIRTGGANVNSVTFADDARHSFIYDADSGEWSAEA